MSSRRIRCYSELIQLETFADRLEYLRLFQRVGNETFGYDRILNQNFYSSPEWKRAKNKVIERDLGRDLGLEGYDISDWSILRVHHMNPITIDDLINASAFLLDPMYLITTTLNTHNYIHYGYDNYHVLSSGMIERSPGDTCPWRKK